jgi:hypothetical protein
MQRLVFASVIALGVGACGGKKDDPSGGGGGGGGGTCPPLKVVHDGVEVPGLTHGYAVTESYRGQRVDRVTLLNHEESCGKLVSRVSSPPAEGEVSVQASASSAALARGLTMGRTNTFGIDVRMLTPAPQRSATWSPSASPRPSSRSPPRTGPSVRW